MKLSRIDVIAQNGNNGEHYKYEDVAMDIVDSVADNIEESYEDIVAGVVKILVDHFDLE